MSTVSGGDTRRLEVTQQLSIIWKCPHIHVCWLTLAVGEDLSSDAKAPGHGISMLPGHPGHGVLAGFQE